MKYTVDLYVTPSFRRRSADWPGEYDAEKCKEINKLAKEMGLDYRFVPVRNAVPDTPAPAVTKNPHYTTQTPEPITVIEGWKLNYNMGNALKYISRAGKKDATVEGHTKDLEKAISYIRREINTLRGEPSWE